MPYSRLARASSSPTSGISHTRPARGSTTKPSSLASGRADPVGERRLRVEPGAYPGRWAFEETWHRGAATVALRPGPNAFRIGAVGDFDVHLGPPSAGRPPVLTAPDGTARVVERDAPRALPRLFLETKPLLVVVREYRGDWHLAGVNEPSDRLAGRRSMVPLVRGLDYQFVVAAEGTGGTVFVVGNDLSFSARLRRSTSKSPAC